jgi:hypothetical protein
LDPLPAQALALLREALDRRKTGLLLLGTSEIEEHCASSLVNAALALTDFAGPAARIKPRTRGTPSKDWDVPEALKALPFLPSIESAYSQGFRRMVINPTYTEAEVLLGYEDKVLFIAGGYGSSVEDVFLGGLRYRGMDQSESALNSLVAILAVATLKTPTGHVQLSDMFVPKGQVLKGADTFTEALEVLRQGRVLRAEEHLTRLLDDDLVSATEVRKLLPRVKWATDLLATRSRKSRATAKP